MVFITEGFFEVAIESWRVWDLNPRPINSVHIYIYIFVHTWLSYKFVYLYIHIHLGPWITLMRTEYFLFVYHNISFLVNLSIWCFEHSGDITCCLLVKRSHTEECWDGRSTCLRIYIYIYKYIYIYIYSSIYIYIVYV